MNTLNLPNGEERNMSYYTVPLTAPVSEEYFCKNALIIFRELGALQGVYTCKPTTDGKSITHEIDFGIEGLVARDSLAITLPLNEAKQIPFFLVKGTRITPQIARQAGLLLEQGQQPL